MGGLKLGGYEKHQQKLCQERKEEYRKYLAEVHVSTDIMFFVICVLINFFLTK